MGKENKKQTKVKYNTAEQEEILKFLIVIVIVMIAVGGIYVATRIFVTKDFFKTEPAKNEQVAEPDFDYSMTIMGSVFNRPYKEYYVLIYDEAEGNYTNDMYQLISKYNKKEKKSLHMYSVDLSNPLNDGYYNPENVNVNAKTLSELKVGDITLLRIKNGKISKYIVDLDKMKTELGVE